MKIDNILETIGNTPHLRVNKLFDKNYEVWVKLERFNPGGSIKDRIGLAMIEDAEKREILKPGATIVEPTSGNTGIGLAIAAAIKGYKLILVMPESFSIERRKLMAAYGANFELTAREKGMNGAIEKAAELVKSIEGAWSPSQFDNPANPEIHRKTTALEIIADFKDGLDVFVSGVGTGGHLSGIAEVLKKQFPKLKVYAIEPDVAPFISKGEFGPHAIQGIGPNFIPGNLNRDIIDHVIQVTKEEAYDYTLRFAKEEGVLGGISTGASLAGVSKILPTLPPKSKILTVNYDTGERYLSIDGLF
jgi:cysteine synthase